VYVKKGERRRKIIKEEKHEKKGKDKEEDMKEKKDE